MRRNLNKMFQKTETTYCINDSEANKCLLLQTGSSTMLKKNNALYIFKLKNTRRHRAGISFELVLIACWLIQFGSMFVETRVRRIKQ